MHAKQPSSETTRRQFLALLGAGATAAFAGCQAADHPSLGVTPVAPGLIGREVASAAPSAVKPAIPMAPPRVTASVPSSDVIGRSVWADAGPLYWKLKPMNGVERITFHHSGDPKLFFGTTLDQTIAQLRKDRSAHVNDRNFADIGYHFAIDRTGRVWQLRSLRYQGEHVWGENTHNLGIVVLGNFEIQHMTAVQQARVKSFGAIVRRKYGLSISQVHTHQEIAVAGHTTLCPGRNMQPFMEYVRENALI
jgi:hypothetical protein